MEEMNVLDQNRDSDDEESVGSGGILSEVQLGFIVDGQTNALFHDRDWMSWDGGKVGGKPVRMSII